MSKKENYKIKDRKKEKGELFLVVEIFQDFILQFRNKAIKTIGRDLEIKGFRKGMAPEKIILENVGEMKVLQEQAYIALNEIVPKIVLEEKINSITNPKIEISKIGIGDNLEFKISFVLMPEVELPDYKSIAKSIEAETKIDVSKKEIDEYINYILKQRAESDFIQKKTTGEKVDEKDKNKLPDFNDEFVKTLGDFKSADDFKKQLHENMLADKKIKSQQNRRIKIVEKIISESKVEIPDILVDEEIERIFHNFKHQIESMRIQFSEYLKQIKKTEEDLKKDWQADALKRVKIDLVLPKIAQVEKIKPDQDKIEKELTHLKEHHKDINEYHARVYITHALTNEKVFDFLENLK